MILCPRDGMPEGPHSGSGNQGNYGPRILAACWIVETLSTTFLGLRIYCKFKRSRQPWYDDYVLIAAWLFQTADIVLITVNVTLGVGQHMANLEPSVWPIIERNGNISGTLSITAAVLSKTSFGITLLRLAETERFTKWLIWFLLVTMNIALGLSAVFIWADPTRPGHAQPIARYNLFSGAYSAFVDFALVFLPWSLIWNLQMHPREKMGVALAMSMGVFAGIGTIAKLTQLPNLSQGDFTFYETGILIWGNVETAVTIMAVSVPFLRILFVEARSASGARDHFVPRLKISTAVGDEQGLIPEDAGSGKEKTMFAEDTARRS